MFFKNLSLKEANGGFSCDYKIKGEIKGDATLFLDGQSLETASPCRQGVPTALQTYPTQMVGSFDYYGAQSPTVLRRLLPIAKRTNRDTVRAILGMMGSLLDHVKKG